MTVWVEMRGAVRRVELSGNGEGSLPCSVDGAAREVDVRPVQTGILSVVSETRQYRCILDGDGVWVNGVRFGFRLEDPRSLRGRKGAGAGTTGPRAVKAPMPGRVVRVLVALGDEVAEGQGVVVIEAMKMQNELKAPRAGRVVKLSAAVGETVASGDVLVVVD